MAQEKTINLKTVLTPLGDECVRRTPPKLKAARKEADVVKILNDNQAGSGQDITVFFNPAQASSVFDPAPPPQTVLAPQQSLVLAVRALTNGTVQTEFLTAPGRCTGDDQDDIVIHC